MIDKDKLIEIGKFQRTHALKGELNAILDVPEDYVEDGNPLVVFTGEYLCLIMPSRYVRKALHPSLSSWRG